MSFLWTCSPTIRLNLQSFMRTFEASVLQLFHMFIIYINTLKFITHWTSTKYLANSSIPKILSMSCGTGVPSTRISPFFTKSPSCTLRYFDLGIKVSKVSVSSGDVIITFFYFYNLSKILPSISHIVRSLGFLASNSSATLGKPPVISLVLMIFWYSCNNLTSRNFLPIFNT